MKLLRIILVLFSVCMTMPLQAAEKLGVVLLHGKWGTSAPGSPIGPLIDYLDENGILVSAPEMPWSRERGLDKSYEDAMQEIDIAVNELRHKGATRIVVGGHSMGANAVIGYAARHDGLAGVLAIAPGHVPELPGFQDKMDNDWRRAKAMVDSGQGDELTAFKDVNQGRQIEKVIKASIYLSWYNPDGSAVMPVNVARLKPGTALFWIVGERDRMFERGREYAFSRALSNPKNAYVVVRGGHRVTPEKGKTEILEWLQNL